MVILQIPCMVCLGVADPVFMWLASVTDDCNKLAKELTPRTVALATVKRSHDFNWPLILILESVQSDNCHPTLDNVI